MDCKEAVARTWTLGLECNEGNAEERRNVGANEVDDGSWIKSCKEEPHTNALF